VKVRIFCEDHYSRGKLEIGIKWQYAGVNCKGKYGEQRTLGKDHPIHELEIEKKLF
jgi:hypothetical protein